MRGFGLLILLAMTSSLLAQEPASAPQNGPTSVSAAGPASRPTLPSGPPVPEATVRSLGEALAAAESATAPSAKLRQLRAVYRDGLQLEQRYAEAPNLHVIRTVMLNAARSLAATEGDTASAKR